MKTAHLEGAQLDYWVAQAQGIQNIKFNFEGRVLIPENKSWTAIYSPSGDWAQGGPVIESEGIAIYRNYIRDGSGRFNGWIACLGIPAVVGQGQTPLIAAMRAYLASKFGDEVPDQRET